VLQRGRGSLPAAGRGYVTATPASVLRQQVFHFGSDAGGANGQPNNVGLVGGGGGLNEYSVSSAMQANPAFADNGSIGGGVSGLSLAGSSVIGRTGSSGSAASNMNNNVLSTGNYGNGNMYNNYIPTAGTANALQPNAPMGMMSGGRHLAGPTAVASSGANPRNNTENEEMLRQLFPGWF
jgi:hypothetical protein